MWRCWWAAAAFISRPSPAVFSLLVSRKAPEGAGLAEVKKNSKILELLRDSLGVDHGYDPAAWEKWWKENEGRFRDVP